MDSKEIDAYLKSMKATKKAGTPLAKKFKEPEPKNFLQEEIDRLKKEIKKPAPVGKRQPRTRKKVAHNGKGYSYVRNEDGKMVLQGRHVMEEHLGYKIPEHMVVMYRDGNRSNCKLENLYLGYRAGTPLDFLTCTHCGSRGNWKVEPPNEK